MSVQSEMRLYLRVLWRYKWIIGLCTGTSIAVALGVTLLMAPYYTSGIILRVAGAPAGILDFGSLAFATRLSNTYVEVVQSGPVLGMLAREFGPDNMPSVKATTMPDTELIEITTTHADPDIAYAAAQLLGDLLVERSFELYSGTGEASTSVLETQVQAASALLDEAVAAYESALAIPDVPEAEITLRRDIVTLRSEIYGELVQRLDIAVLNEAVRGGAVTIMDPAYFPEGAAGPSKVMNTMLGAVAGLGLGVVLAFMFDSLDTRLRIPEDVARVAGNLPLMARIPDVTRPLRFWHAQETFVTGFSDHGSYDEAYRQLWVRLALMRPDVLSNSLLVTSPTPGTGKSTVVANIGKMLAGTGRRALLVDLDMRRPQLHHLLEIGYTAGLSDVLRNDCMLSDAIQRTDFELIDLLPAGIAHDYINLADHMDDLAMVLHQLGERYDHVIVDSPALLYVADTLIAARQAAAVLLVVSLNHTTAPQVADSLRYLDELQADVAGIVVNRVGGLPRKAIYGSLHDTQRGLRKSRERGQTDVVADR